MRKAIKHTNQKKEDKSMLSASLHIKNTRGSGPKRTLMMKEKIRNSKKKIQKLF